MAESGKIDVRIRLDDHELRARMAESVAALDALANTSSIRAMRAAAVLEAQCLVAARASLPRGLKWLVGFPRILRRYYAVWPERCPIVRRDAR